jgi:hypothetical protein
MMIFVRNGGIFSFLSKIPSMTDLKRRGWTEVEREKQIMQTMARTNFAQ